jgi:hypothetical protein
MTYDAPLSPRPLGRLDHLTGSGRRVLTARALREHGVSTAVAGARCRPGGPWQMLLPGVYLLHPGTPTSEDRLRAALLYAERRAVPAQAGPDRSPAAAHRPQGPEAMVTGLAALALHGFDCAPPLTTLDRIDVLLPRTRRLRSVGCAHVVRAQRLPEPVHITGLPVAPAARALADAVQEGADPVTVRRLMTEAVRGGHCDPQEVLEELGRARLLARPQIADAADTLVAEARGLAEGDLYAAVFAGRLPDPCWNVRLRLPGGPHLADVDAYWPDHAVAAVLPGGDDALRRQTLEGLGITVVVPAPQPEQEAGQDDLSRRAAVLRTALMAAEDREPAAHVEVLPR